VGYNFVVTLRVYLHLFSRLAIILTSTVLYDTPVDGRADRRTGNSI